MSSAYDSVSDVFDVGCLDIWRPGEGIIAPRNMAFLTGIKRDRGGIRGRCGGAGATPLLQGLGGSIPGGKTL